MASYTPTPGRCMLRFSIFAIFYFIIGVWYAGSAEDLMIGLYIIFTSLVFFLGTVIYTRFMGKQMKVQDSAD
jgi:uncharacterized membrane protein